MKTPLAAVFMPLILAVAACSAASSPTPTPTGPLLTVEARGGLCPAGTCSRMVVIERDGRVRETAKPPNDLGIVPADALAALDAAIRATDFDELRSHPFTGTCPTAYDGQEVVFEFGAPSGVERIASCEVEVDYGDPLFLAVARAIGPFIVFQTR